MRDLKDYHDGLADVHNFMKAFPDINFRYYIEPSTALPGGLKLLDVTNSTNTWPMQMQGRKDGKEAIAMGEGAIFEKMQEWDNSSDLQSNFSRLGDYIQHVKNQFI